MTQPPVAIIDAHHHLWDPRLRSYDFLEGLPQIDRAFESSDLSDVTAGLGISRTIVVQAVGEAGETDWLLELASGSALIAGVVGWVDLQHPSVGDRLAEVAGGPLVGIRHPAQDEADPGWLLRPAVQHGLHAVHEAGLPFDLLVKRPQRAAALELVGILSEVTFVIDHLGKPEIATGEWDSWVEWMTAISSHPNVRCKISGLVTEASWTAWRAQRLERYVAVALEVFGPERCMFGSDWPVSLLAAEYSEVLGLAHSATSALSGSERGSVFHDTAAQTYGLEVI